MGAITPTLSGMQGRTLEANTLQVTLGSLEGGQDQSSGIIFGFATLLAVLLVITASCILCTWNKRKKRRVPYLRVTGMPSLTLPRPGQRAKNIYDLLPPRQEDLGRCQSRSIRVFSTESLLSRNPDPPGHVPSQASSTLQGHGARIPTVGFAVGIYDNAPVPHACQTLVPAAHHANDGAPGQRTSSASEDANDYVNVPAADAAAEPPASACGAPGCCFAQHGAQGLGFTEESHEGCGDAGDYSTLWCPADPLSEGDSCSQASDDYVNMAGLELAGSQEAQLWAALQRCGDDGNVAPAQADGSQQPAGGEATSSTPDGAAAGRAQGPGTHLQPVSRRLLASGEVVAFQPPAESESCQLQRERTSSEDSSDYENVLAVQPGGQDAGIWLPPDQLRPRHPTGTPRDTLCPAGSLPAEEPQGDSGPP
ncbi:lymphocyte transmembrane adapter 1 [Lepus europaeus]|uniref:lymphocyte transmembrane adapter 1 n=1 Tax=Lepus europaeus TaxID=9983 RepID=UPI002B4969C3|nr:lymphocyte transmembrane adapter 1 [Lepus europaeus]